MRTYHQWFSNYSYTQPSYVPEFQAGWFSAWGDIFYDEVRVPLESCDLLWFPAHILTLSQCASLHDPAFADVYYKNNIGQRITMQSLYMAYGGTNWGHCTYRRELISVQTLIDLPSCGTRRLHELRLQLSAPRNSPAVEYALPDQAGEHVL